MRYKKLDGVPKALAALAEKWFPGGRQRVALNDAVAALKLPVQIIGAREDRIIPVAHAEALASRLPVHIIEQTGHLPHMEKAGEVNRLIKRLIENPSLGAAGGGEAAAQESTHEPVAAAAGLGRRRFCRRSGGLGRAGCCRCRFGGIAAVEILVAEGQTNVFFFDHFERFLVVSFGYCRSYFTTRRTRPHSPG